MNPLPYNECSPEQTQWYLDHFVEEVMGTANRLYAICGGKAAFEGYHVLAEPGYVVALGERLIQQAAFGGPVFRSEDRRFVSVMHTAGEIQIRMSTHPIRGYASKRPWMWSKKDRLTLKELEGLFPGRVRDMLEWHVREDLEFHLQAFGVPRPPPAAEPSEWPYSGDRRMHLKIFTPVTVGEGRHSFRWGSMNPPAFADGEVEVEWVPAALGTTTFLANYDWDPWMTIRGDGKSVWDTKDPQFVKREGDW